MDAILDDKRTIVAIFWPGGGEQRVGKLGVISIAVETIKGQMADVPWFTVRCENGDVWRYNAALVEGVKYAPPGLF